VERKRFEQDLTRRFSGGNAGGILVNNGAWEFTPVNYAPADMAGKDLAEYDRNCLASIFGVPPTYFTTDTNLANLEAADEFFARFGVDPACWSLSGTLTSLVRRWDPRLYVMHDPVIAEDELQRAQIDKIYVDMGSVTLNQLNEEKKYPAVPWGNEPLLPNNLVPASVLIEQAKQALQQQQEAHDQAMETAQAGIEQGDQSLEHDGKRVEIEKEKVKAAAKVKPAAEPGKREVPIEDLIERALDRLEDEVAKRRAG